MLTDTKKELKTIKSQHQDLTKEFVFLEKSTECLQQNFDKQNDSNDDLINRNTSLTEENKLMRHHVEIYELEKVKFEKSHDDHRRVVASF